jgi:tellurite resistance protein
VSSQATSRGATRVAPDGAGCDTRTMATKADFTDEEWKSLREGVVGAGMYVATSDPGFFDNFKEASALAHHLRDAHEKSDSVLIRDIATGHDRPFGATDSPAEVEQATLSTLQSALAALAAKAPEEVPAYRQLVLDVAESVAEAAKGVSPKENQALEKIREALGA